jgi:ATP-dependent Clp protease ATP-binding subunit ClpA
VFVGDAGVGKTAMAEGLAQRLLQPEVPARARRRRGLRARYDRAPGRDALPRRLRRTLQGRPQRAQERRNPILFIDELHSIVGAGATTGGTMDLATLLKPVLTAGGLRVVGSTTFDEYKQIEKDRALSRRFQKVVLQEPSVEEAVRILQGLQKRYEEHHGVAYTPAAVEAAVKLAARHLRDYRLPDSAIDLLDEAGAMVRMQHAAAPRTVDAAVSAAGTAAAPLAPESAVAATEPPLPVDVPEIETVVARIANIPARQASSSDKDRLRTLGEALGRVVFGQEEAVALGDERDQAIARRARHARTAGGLLPVHRTDRCRKDGACPVSSRFTSATSSRGFDMSEYMEKHAVARLIGAPPATWASSKAVCWSMPCGSIPTTSVLLDEIEKAHPDVMNILLQVMDHATLTDNTGRKADFRHVILIMTSNAGSRELSAASIGFAETGRRDSELADEARWRAAQTRSKAAVERMFSPEFRNRLDGTVTFRPLTQQTMETIVEKFILQLEAQLAERKWRSRSRPEARTWLARRVRSVYGARPLARVIQQEVRNPLTDEILFGRLEQGGHVRIRLDGDRLLRLRLRPAASGMAMG